jgi:regulator of protease activity HflC (stomatin/prohibitin superfamily)
VSEERPTVSLAGARLGRLIGPIGGGLLALAIVAAVGLYVSSTVHIAPDQFAVRQVYFGPGQGIQKQVVGPGVELVVPGYERLHLFPRDLQILDLNAEESTYTGTHLTEDYTMAPAIIIQTSDGFPVTVDVTVMYRIVDPYIVLTKIGPGRLYEKSVVQRLADRTLRQNLGRLGAEDFYNGDKRMAAEHDARVAMTKDMTEWGIQVWSVMIRDYLYAERFQAQIEARKNEDQRKFKNQAETLREKRLAEKNRRVAEMQRTIEQTRGEGDLAVRRIKSDADLYYRTQVAEGDRALGVAAADSAKLERQSLEQAGASNLVGLEMAKALSGTEVIVVSTTGPGAVNPLDLNSLVRGW